MVTEGLQMTDPLIQMTASLMPMEMCSELYGYGVPPNDRLLDANGNAQRGLWLWVAECLQVTASLMPVEMLKRTLWLRSASE